MKSGANSLTLRDRLQHRDLLLRAVRDYFSQAQLIEVQTPCLSQDNVVDAHIDPVIVPGKSLLLPHGMAAPEYYLQTSPEFCMKRLLAAGSGSIYSLGPVFRAGERSHRHNIEFTMLEWYVVDGGMDLVIEQTIELLQLAIAHGQQHQLIDASQWAPVQRWSYRELFQTKLGFDPIAEPVETLQRVVSEVDESLARALTGQRDELLDVLMTERLEPMLADQIVLIHHYPLSQAALARQSERDPQTAERFELLVHGLELANGYGELLDADELRARNIQNNQKRLATGRTELPIDSRLLTAMRGGMPACSGVALGFDRLLMIAMGTTDVADVLPFPIEVA